MRTDERTDRHDKTNVALFETSQTHLKKNPPLCMTKDYFMKKIGLMEVHRLAVLVNFTFSVLCFIVQILQFEPTNAHNFVKITLII